MVRSTNLSLTATAILVAMTASAMAQTRYVPPKQTVAPIQSGLAKNSGLAGSVKPTPGVQAPKAGFANSGAGIISRDGAGLVNAGGLNMRR